MKQAFYHNMSQTVVLSCRWVNDVEKGRKYNKSILKKIYIFIAATTHTHTNGKKMN